MLLFLEYAYSARLCSRPVRAGTVLFSTTSLGVFASAAIWRATLSLADRSASPESFGGVPTQIKMASPLRVASPAAAGEDVRPRLGAHPGIRARRSSLIEAA